MIPYTPLTEENLTRAITELTPDQIDSMGPVMGIRPKAASRWSYDRLSPHATPVIEKPQYIPGTVSLQCHSPRAVLAHAHSMPKAASGQIISYHIFSLSGNL